MHDPRRGAPGDGSQRRCAVARFRDKPDRATAASLLASGKIFWNSGAFALGARHHLHDSHRRVYRP